MIVIALTYRYIDSRHYGVQSRTYINRRHETRSQIIIKTSAVSSVVINENGGPLTRILLTLLSDSTT